ncbi:MAG: hypothetical protein HYR63_23720 [Proteobacteria bacterium]|nr:hypothetical protein [Pseudomonadota bacterium]
MTKTDEPFEAARALLPWYVNGTLEPDERRMVEAALGASAALRAELSHMQTLGWLVAADADQAPLPAVDGFARLEAMMRQETGHRPRPLQGWQEALAGFFGPWMRPAVFALLATVVVVESIAVIALLPGGEPQRFVTAAGPQTEGLRALVLFRPETTLLQIRTVLQAEQGTIVRGPTPDGSVVVQWVGLSADAVDQAIKRLRARPDLVLRAERGS